MRGDGTPRTPSKEIPFCGMKNILYHIQLCWVSWRVASVLRCVELGGESVGRRQTLEDWEAEEHEWREDGKEVGDLH